MTKVLVSLEESLLRRIDRIAKSRGLSRSAYLAELAQEDTARALGRGSDPTVRRALESLDDLFISGAASAGDSTVAVRAERDSR